MHHHKWSLSEVENLLPWEKEIYCSLLVKALEEEKRQHESQQNR
ncbi:MAG: baseplate protein [Acidobacteria bacterium]|uniref:Baseplate protein n=1 Tax=marine metagenome TaxID=408172 RepID=A0A382LSA4_9ZZZZ|nr:baseplate protein [Acidobacteriota bacterium]